MSLDVAARIGRAAGATLLLAGPAISPEQVESIELPSLQVSRDGLDPSPDRQPDLPPALVDPSTLAEILFTSGTTSDPKGVMITHGQMIHSVRAIALTAGGLHRERALALIPLSHAYGQMVPLFYGLVTGSQITFIGTMTPARLLDALRRDSITAITVVPQFLELLMDRIEGEAGRRGALTRLRRIRRLALALHLPIPVRRWLFRDVLAGLGGGLSILSCGGARLPVELQLAWEGLGVIVVQGYGATECSAIAGHDRRSRRPGTVGPPLAGIEVRIAPDGELLARGPNAMSGYWRRPEETAEVLEGGWVHTGDAATVDAHGELVIMGRTRDRIALPNGMKVYPEDVERPLLAQDAIRAAVALEGSPGQLVAILVPAADASTDAQLDAAVAAANESLAQHQRIRRWRRWPDADFPRTHTFKVRRSEVAGWYASEARGGSAAAGGEGGAS
jgi:long-chain acyl-CoA synthetase